SQVIAAIDWVVQHRNDNGLNIRVLNIAYGSDSSQPYEVDPLAFAAEQAVRAGIVVVAAAGNAGFSKSGTLANPASDPFTLAVGASDAMG
ncbi:S8 family serine peptidase, partial [Salmonella sp. SAL4438]|uniref:S8 family serine peptidase n=1 Tax=Salmonella sp. SAL4438 TaxID=3159893 RepID=UPI00397E3E20